MNDRTRRRGLFTLRRSLTRLGLLALAVVLSIAALSSMGLPISSATALTSGPATSTEYYVAMGDSLAAGVGASQPANDYVNLVYQHERAHYPNLQLVNFSCSGATTTLVLHGGADDGCSYSTGTQLGDAEAFLKLHPGQVPLLSIDIGGNDVDGCFGSSGINATCIQNGMNQISGNLPPIVNGLEAAYPGLSVYGMDYYDPFLQQWLNGTNGQALAEQSETDTVSLNGLLGQIYSSAGASMADPASLFDLTDFSLTGSYQGMTVPQNVALTCAWTRMCSLGDIHTNDAGHAELAASFEQVIPRTPTSATTTVVSVSPSLAVAGAPISYSATVFNASGIPTGAVAFSVGAISLCSTVLSSGTGSCTSSNAPLGADVVTATYGGVSGFAPSSDMTPLTISNSKASVACSKLSGKTSTSIKLKTCTVLSKTNKTSSTAGTFITSGGSLTWAPSDQTTIVSVVPTSPGQGACKKNTTENDLAGIVTGGTSTYTHIYDPVSIRVCVTKHGGVSLLPGTTASI
jgi:lysophospholipase L1-like esterase